MAIVPCAAAGVELSGDTKFVALDGTRTFSVRLRDVIIPDPFVLADPSDAFIKRIRAGFVLLQAGLGVGLVPGCLALMNQVKGPPGHAHKYSAVHPPPPPPHPPPTPTTSHTSPPPPHLAT